MSGLTGGAAAVSQQVVSTVAGWDDLAPRWRALVAETAPPAAPFVAPEFARAWWSVFGETAGVELEIVALESEGELVGVLPLARDAAAARWLGDHEVADYMGPIAAAGCEPALVEALFDQTQRSGLTALDLRGLDAASPLISLIEEAAERRGWRAALSEEAVCPVVDLAGGWEAYLDRLRSRDRREVRRKLRPLRQLGSALQFDVLRGSEAAAQLPLLLQMMSGSRGDKAAFLTQPMERFFLALGEAMSAHGWLRLHRLTVSGEPAAMVLCWETDDQLMLYNSGFDARFRDLNVGLASKVLCLRDAAQRGLRRVNFLRGDEPYKFELGGQANPVQRLLLQRPD